MQTLAVLFATAHLVSSTINDENQTSICNDPSTSFLDNETLFMTSPVFTQARTLPTLSTQTLIDQLYKRILVGDYESAVIRCLQLELEGKGQVILDTVNKLLIGGKRNVIEFAYKLWNMFGRNIVKDYFPIQFMLLLNEGGIVLVDKKYDVPLNVVTNADSESSRLAFGDGNVTNSNRLRWNMKSIWEGNKVHFMIINNLHKQCLKLVVATNSSDEHKGYTANVCDTYRHQWNLHPVMYEGELLFYIINREYNQALKLSSTIDNEGNRHLWSNNGVYIGNPVRFGWYIKPYE